MYNVIVLYVNAKFLLSFFISYLSFLLYACMCVCVIICLFVFPIMFLSSVNLTRYSIYYDRTKSR